MTIFKQLHTRLVDITNLQLEDIDLDDICKPLSQVCRFDGHTSFFYSVAEHCLAVAAKLPQDLRLWGLLHDAAEAYIGDISAPLKDCYSNLQTLEAKILAKIAIRFRLDPWPMPMEVYVVDKQIALTEARDLLGVTDFSKWKNGHLKPYPKNIYSISGTSTLSMDEVANRYRREIETCLKYAKTYI